MIEGLVFSVMVSTHIGWERSFNDIHPSISYEHKDYAVGVYRNSLNENSFFVSKTKNLGEELKVQYGLVTGYAKNVLPLLIFRKEIAEGMNIVFLPSYNTTKNRTAAVLGIELLFKGS